MAVTSMSTGRSSAAVISGGSNKPLNFDTPGSAFRVTSGYADVFALDPTGNRRRHLFRATSGALLFGGGSADGKVIVVGSLGSIFEALNARQAVEDMVAVERWVEDMTLAVTEGGADWPTHLLGEGQQQLEPGEDYGIAARQTVWLQLEAGSLAWLGTALREGQFIPLVTPGRIQTGSGATVNVLSAPTAEQRNAAISTLNMTVLALLSQRFDSEQHNAEARFRDTQHRGSRALASALGRLAGIGPHERHDAGDPWMSAIATVMRASGHEPPQLARPLIAEATGDHAERVLAQLNLPYRPVQLTQGWWRRDGLPFLGRMRDGTPLALIPAGSGRWRALGQGTDRLVSGNMAAGISAMGLQIYPALPDRPLHLRDLLGFGVRGAGVDLRQIVVMAMLGAAAMMAIPFATGILFDTVVPLGDRMGLVQVVLALCAFALGQFLFDLVRTLGVARIEARLDAKLQAAIVSRLLRLPVTFFRRFSVGDLAERTLGLQDIRQLVTGSAIGGLFSTIGIVSSLAAMALIDWRMALFALVPVSIIAGTSALLSWAQLRHERERVRLNGKVEGFVLQLMVGISKLRSAAAERRSLAEWAWRSTPLRQAFRRARRLAGFQAVSQAVLLPLALLFIFCITLVLAKSDAAAAALSALVPGNNPAAAATMSAGKFVAFIAAFGQLSGAIAAAVGAATQMLSIGPMLERTQPLLEAVPEQQERGDDPGRLMGALELRQISFSYGAETPLVLDDVSFAIHPGEYVAIVGPSGGGKSTILRLLLGFDRPDKGEIYFDGKPAERLDRAALRAQIGVVLQNGRITAGSMFENIVGATGLGIDDAWAAARLVDLAEDIEAMPMGMHTVLTDGGGTLSGGQRQRVLLARALVRRPQILLLDEATSALDNRTQTTVTQTLADLNVTRIVIAHRLSTIREVDRILYIENGRLIEAGTYDSLIKTGGAFSALAQRQLI